jgi:hypothetical protein
MAILSKSSRKNTKVEIDLTGPQGNAFHLIGLAQSYAKQLGLDSSQITSEMMSGDYESLIKTFDKYFGDYVILYR